jgi:ABC-type transport system substrate-binding protein
MRIFSRACHTLLPICLALLAGCSSNSEDVLPLAVIGGSGTLFESGGRLSPAGQLVRGATTEGLVAFDEQGRVIPALADRWIVTDDGLSYIFRLRDGNWPDGSELTAVSARTALGKALAAVRGMPLGADLAGLSEIRAMAGRVIELRLDYPNPDLLQLLAQPELGLIRLSRGAGPMTLTREGNLAVLRPIAPGKRGLPVQPDWNAQVRSVRLTALPADKAVAAFAAGEAAAVFGGGMADYPLARSIGLTRGITQIDPVAGLFGLVVTTSAGFLNSPENRETLAMAIDRDALASAIGNSGWTPSTRIVSPLMEGDLGTIGERWGELSSAERHRKAAERVKIWLGAKPGPVTIRIALPAGPGADLLFGRLQQDFTAIGIESRRVGESAPAELRLIDSVARYARASWFLGQLGCAARRGQCSAAADTLAAQARRAPDAASRSALLAEAEAELTAANVFIPLGPPLRWSLLQRDIGSGFVANRWGVHPLMPLAMVPR